MKKLVDWKRAAILRHIWSIFSRSGSLWVAWVHVNLIQGKNYVMGVIYLCGWMHGTWMVFFLTNIDIGLSMMLESK